MVHLLLSALPKNDNIPGELLHAVMLQFQVAGLMLALAILYISLAFYFYTDPSNPRFLGIGGIIMVASVISVPLVYGLLGTWNIIIISLPKRAPNDGEPPTFRAWIREEFQNLTYSEYRNRLKECWGNWDVVKSCKSGEFTQAIATYWNIMSTLSLFRPDWKRLQRYIFAFILLEFAAFFVFFALGLVEMVKAPMKCS
ncbi:hypothetical protein ASPBRDRAFT_678124 [Aspergillus brasiliensis CBS 101740]|uniref:Uncharacterized protein n=1 Tax=Aspergillus brasiliensis (strain CBS 101740 / IMI 381727 / IBT 21946) TaxID=767769 RepID=A0A1L9UDP0_ASPBC|nr:hypothetical protein ASPBRDRAFT_678124 [Aspergillus brasiliensis CBS 101740]